MPLPAPHPCPCLPHPKLGVSPLEVGEREIRSPASPRLRLHALAPLGGTSRTGGTRASAPWVAGPADCRQAGTSPCLSCAVAFANLFFLLTCQDSSVREGTYGFKNSSFMGDFLPHLVPVTSHPSLSCLHVGKRGCQS